MYLLVPSSIASYYSPKADAQLAATYYLHCHWLSVFSCQTWEIRAQKNKSESDWPSASAASACSYSSWFVDHHDFGRLQQLHTRGTSESAPLMAVPRSSHSCSLWSRLRPSASHGPSGGYGRQSTELNCSQLMACRQCSTADAVGLTAAAVGLQRCRHPAGAFNLLERPWPLLVDCWLAPAVFSASEGASSSEL